MLRAVIFDMDGVLIDSEPLHYRLESELFGRLGLDLDDEERRSYVGTTSRWMWTHLKNHHHLKPSVEELMELEHRTYLEMLHAEPEWKPIPGVAELIDELHSQSIILAVASSSSLSIITTVLQLLDFQRYFSVCIGGEEGENSKPAPDIFLKAAAKAAVSPATCVVIEDSRAGVMAAKAAGMKCLGFRSPHCGSQDLSGADRQVERLTDIHSEDLKTLCDGEA